MKRETILFLSSKNPYSKTDWSGIPFYMFKALAQHYQVIFVPLPKFKSIKLGGYYFSKLLKKAFNINYTFDYGLLLAGFYGILGTLRVKKHKDIKFIFSPAGLTETAYLQTSIPIVSAGDCSTLQLINYYPTMVKVSDLSKWEITRVESKAMKRNSLAVFSSEWATTFVQRNYKINKVFTIPFGSNNQASIPQIEKQAPTKRRCNLLFVGVDWKRKGGNVVLEIHEKLLGKGIESRLTIIGSVIPKECIIPKSVRVIESIDKDTFEGENLFNTIFQESDFFILPTLADCTPLVIAEAFSFGIPVLATRTGGIPSMVIENETGFLFVEYDTKGYVNTIESLCKDSVQYYTLSQKCKKFHCDVLNWQSWALRLKQLVSSTGS